jgi:RimJ/RimL family protein N-acetyltransferase
VSKLIDFSRDEKISRIVVHILSDNQAMLRLARHFHFKISLDEDPASCLALLEVTPQL